jgi:undecaprenyl pyrophosphate synthase
MTNKPNPEVKTETVEQELVEDKQGFEEEFDDIEIDSLMPTMTVSTEIVNEPEKECIVKDEDVLDLYDEILQNCRKDRESVGEVLTNFLDMVLNDGDSSSASKEAIVNLIKIKSDVNDKMAKIADLRTRIKLKEKDTYPRYLAAQQNNVVIEGSKREMIKTINKLAQRKKNDKSN